MASGADHAHDTHPMRRPCCATGTDALATTAVLCICACAFYASAIHITAPIQRLLQRLLQPLVLRHLAWQRLLLAQTLLHAIHRALPAQQRPCSNIYRTSKRLRSCPNACRVWFAVRGLPCVGRSILPAWLGRARQQPTLPQAGATKRACPLYGKPCLVRRALLMDAAAILRSALVI